MFNLERTKEKEVKLFEPQSIDLKIACFSPRIHWGKRPKKTNKQTNKKSKSTRVCSVRRLSEYLLSDFRWLFILS